VILNYFYLLSFLAVMFAVLVVLSRNPVHSVLYLVMTFFCIAGHYILLSAEFLAAVHVIVYAGAIMVLFLFVIMHLNLNRETEPHKSNLIKVSATICAGLFLVILIGSLKSSGLTDPQTAVAGIGLVKELGRVMFTTFLLPFEVTSLLLLAAMVGAVMLMKEERG
jgi:NADH-quinone oxidoreductase subunit J